MATWRWVTLYTSLLHSYQNLSVVSLIHTLPPHWRSAMLRIYKHYSFQLQTLRPAAARMSFSSYPGELFSDDDFYILSSGLVILQVNCWERWGESWVRGLLRGSQAAIFHSMLLRPDGTRALV